MMVLGMIGRSADRMEAFVFPAGEPVWHNVALPRSGRPPLSFSGSAIARHSSAFQGDQDLALELWRRRLTGFVISYPVCGDDVIIRDAVLVDSVAEAVLFIEDLCAFPPPVDPPFKPSLAGILSVQRQAYFNQSFAALAGQALADWAMLMQEPDTSRPKRKSRA